MSDLTLDAPLDRLKGIGPGAELLRARKGLATVHDLLQLPPHLTRRSPRRRRSRSSSPARPPASASASAGAGLGTARRRVAARRRGRERRARGVRLGPRWLITSATRDRRVGAADLHDGEEGNDHVRGTLHQEELPAEPRAVLLPVYRLPEGLAPRLHRRLLRSICAELSSLLAAERPAWAAAALGRPVSLAELDSGCISPRTATRRRARRAFGSRRRSSCRRAC
jgi:hypothetical protein